MRALVFIFVSACGFAPSVLTGSDGMRDAGDAPPGSEPPPQSGCYGTGLGVSVCLVAPPQSKYDVVGTTTIVTTAGSPDCVLLTGATANDYCVVTGTSVNITGFLYAHGTRPLILLSLSTLDVTGSIDVASHRNANPQAVGPAGDDSRCGGTQPDQDTGAGFGGTLGSQGGNGGTSLSHDGVAEAVVATTTLHGGCIGGYGLTATSNGVGGHGGGVIDLIAQGSLSVLGSINASGSGGGGAGPTNNGGGGGGSGGMIVLDSPLMTFDMTTAIYANGGGGGGGSSTSGSSTASNGTDPSGYANGGNGGSGVGGGGGLGGDGASATALAGNGNDGTSSSGNGAGGGGVGIIRVFRASIPVTGHFSPPAS